MGRAPGQAADYSLQVMTNSFSGVVALSCAGAPTAASCTVSPTSVTLSGTTSAPSQVHVTTTAHTLVFPGFERPQFGIGSSIRLELLTALALTLLAGLVGFARQNTHTNRATTAMALVLFGVSLVAGCASVVGTNSPGANNPHTGTPAGSYALTVVGTANGVTHTTTLTLEVN